IVIGGGNVAFDVARTARRLGGEVTLVALEGMDKKSKDAMPADEEEIESAWHEGIIIVPSRGISHVVKEDGKLKLECPQCISVFEGPVFNPKFECSDSVMLEADVVLPTIGQMTDRQFLHSSGLLDRDGRLIVDSVTLQSLVARDVFIGGDVRRIGFLAEAMGEGVKAADSIDKYLSGMDPLTGKRREYRPDPTPVRTSYKHAPEPKWLPEEERLNFNVFEEGLTLAEAIEEGRRCLSCGPCISCKACLAIGVREDLPVVEVDEDLCSGCGMCVYSCNYDAAKLEETEDGKLISYTNKLECKTCGMCVAVCPSNARTFSRVSHFTGSRTDQRVKEVYTSL
ncbi:MAG: FAD-dependent oxidoreductase, partial [Dehalococcoidia bacterium]|nr:FAD-dependent oxidoreductase [Dehalococcoidia bacterium]